MSSAQHTEGPIAAPPADPVATFAASAALRRSVVALSHARESQASDVDDADHWPTDGPLSGIAESRERLAHTSERRIWVAQDAAESAFARDVTAYARLLRDGGMRPRQVLRMVAAVVREAAAPALDGDRLAVAIHDAGRHCVEAYFTR